MPLGLYLSVPFCKTKCSYCNFASGVFSREQFGRYVLVGLWNTLFGYGDFALWTAALAPVVPHSYIPASIIAAPLNLTVSYLGYKWVVFKTHGNYLREWSRCVVVYGSAMVLGIVLLPVVVFLVRVTTGLDRSAPYIAGALLLGFLMRYLLASGAVGPEMRAGLTIGFCGAFTTMSTFSYETVALLTDGELWRASLYLFGSVGGSLAAAFAGIQIANRML